VLSPQEWLSAGALAFGALNAWQNSNIKNAILALKLELTERMGKNEGDVKAITARCGAVHHIE
jgi:hypothetical protein